MIAADSYFFSSSFIGFQGKKGLALHVNHRLVPADDSHEISRLILFLKARTVFSLWSTVNFGGIQALNIMFVLYSKCSQVSNTVSKLFSSLVSIKKSMIHKMFVSMSNTADQKSSLTLVCTVWLHTFQVTCI